MGEKIKVLQFPIGNSYSGVTHYVLGNWKNIDKKRFLFDFATMSKFLSLEKYILETGANVFYVPNYAEDDEEGFYDFMYNLMKNEKYDAVHLHTSRWKSMVAEKAAKDAGVSKIIIHAHNTSVKAGEGEQRQFELNRHIKVRNDLNVDMATDYWACSQGAANFIFGEKIPKSKIVIMKNAIDLEKFKYNENNRKKMRKLFGVEDKFVIGNIGRLTYQKNQEFLLEIAKKMNDEKIVFMFTGSGENEKEYKQFVNDNSLESKVLFTGFRNDPENLYQMYDLFVLPSRFDGLSLAMVEAQAAGVKCITSNYMAEEAKITDLVEFLPLDIDLWVKKIIEIMKSDYSHRDTNKEMKDKGFDLKEQIKILEKKYLEL